MDTTRATEDLLEELAQVDPADAADPAEELAARLAEELETLTEEKDTA